MPVPGGGQPVPVLGLRQGRQRGPEGSHHFRRDSSSSRVLLPAPGKGDGKTKLSKPVIKHHQAGAAPLSSPRIVHTPPTPEPSPAQPRRAPPRTAPGGGRLTASHSGFPRRLQALPPRSPIVAGHPSAALPGAEGLLAAQAQEAAAEQQAAQRRGQGDDSSHRALGSSAHRSYGRPIVFKGGGEEGEAAMAATGSLCSAPRPFRRPQPCAAAISPHSTATGARSAGGRAEGPGRARPGSPPNSPLRRAARRSPGRSPQGGGGGHRAGGGSAAAAVSPLAAGAAVPARRGELPRREGRTRAASLAAARAGFSVAKVAARLPRGARELNTVGTSTRRR